MSEVNPIYAYHQELQRQSKENQERFKRIGSYADPVGKVIFRKRNKNMCLSLNCLSIQDKEQCGYPANKRWQYENYMPKRTV